MKIREKYKTLKLVILIPWLLQIIVFIILIAYLSFKSAQLAVNNISEQLFSEIIFRVEEKFQTYISSAITINKINAKVIENQKIAFNDKDKLIEYFFNQLILFPDITAIYWGNGLGEFYGVGRGRDGYLMKGFSNEENNYTEPFFRYAKKKYSIKQPRLYNVTKREWYKVAIEKQKQTWSKIYTSFGNKTKCLTNVYPIYEPNGKIKGVLGVDIHFNHFNQFLQNLKIANTGQVFVINESGIAIFTSDNKYSYYYKNMPDEVSKIANSNNTLNKAVGQLIIEKFEGKFDKIDKSQQINFNFAEEKYLIKIAPFKDEYGLDWLIVVTVPESDFMGQIHANTRNTIALCITALIVAIIIGILTTRWITRPILKVNSAAKSLASGNWGQKIRLDRKDELGQLAKSFNTMASQLQESFTALEQTNRTLEQKVKERTKKLSETVELLKATQEKLVFENELLKDAQVEEYQYQIGGTLPIDSPTYVVRKADRQLYKALKQRQFCYIFNARQMGKSSLRAKMMHKLVEEGYVCAALDLTEIVSDNTTESQLYHSIIFSLAKKLSLLPEFDYRSWKKNLDYLSPLEKLGEFIEEILLKQVQQSIVIFIDEIDTVLDLKFSVDCFFGFLRSLYNKRADNDSYRRLTIVLIGRTAPSYLIQNPESTPFNIGCGIPLEGFKLDEVERSLINGLRENCHDPHRTIEEVLDWTGGQPFLTQKICSLIRDFSLIINEGEEREFITQLIREKIIEDWENKDQPEHLKTIKNKLTKNKHDSLLLLSKYQEMLSIGEIKDEQTWECLELFLSGIVRKEAGKLKLYNRIYGTVFSRAWVEGEIGNLSTGK
ncbi:AAA-like domain-containing protein [Mastigocoleus testarum]|uniref:HAMP domain-containing protein n=1 Tax=Mastigocoleus testarum BC008 TaxID=371196 RepID=A0A0V7ZNE0_9CYAN|nr:AAA-like domain-containing protein [Mastigocoleus testarum]KST65519.1 hypothetical protein BC008_42090 [Mastigocoleus testarum BC008]KST66093.1 hypothetical protein BC008_24265 [Mastigocoleus testarum BC008]